MPLGTIARLVEKQSSIGPVTVGCLNSLYHSVANLDVSCFSNDTIKQMLLQPINSAEDYCNTLKLSIDDTPPTRYMLCFNRKCNNSRDMPLSTYKDNNNCPCGSSPTLQLFLKLFGPRQGFVKGVATFVITDDLIVMPKGIDNASFGLFKEFGITNPSSMKEMVLNVTKQQVLDLLKCSLLSNSTLTDLFLVKKPSIGDSGFLSSDVEISGDLQITLKLFVRKSDGKILCAEGEQGFVNLLLSFLTFPLGGIARIFGENFSLGSINQLYKSMSELNDKDYFISEEAKKRLVDPCILPYLEISKPVLPICESGILDYYCHYGVSVIRFQYSKDIEGKSYVDNLLQTNLSKMVCPEGYLKGLAMYVATDDLVISPLSPISVLGLHERFETPLDDLKEKIVTIGVKECLGILKASLTSSSALTNGLAHLVTDLKEK
ncbi:uncharacterized protein LOC131611844 [Vicia villosa]|uniref:uncharacterized protein LOC131611844 n=1 Tax=Vicia villosa TaxID=3911 RepID=UPI00273B8732|nr:uncharacterized protein LOC131611844 [Vicia villosa]